jgi:2-keto-4-pentenoate hydratase/2-oxohepta-3-ene-1,7-dioic acid hydratase in catechol pathway
MRWVRYRPAGGGVDRVGVVVDELVHGARPDVTMAGLVVAGRLADAGSQLLAAPDEVVRLADVALAAPIETPPSLRDFMAFERHVEGMGRLAGASPPVPDVWYRQPLYYFSNPACLLGPADDVAMPPGCELFDFELEVAAVVGPRPGNAPLTDLTVAEAAGAIVGYTLMNDWTARDLQAAEMQGPLGPCKGKDFATSLGPWLLTADELPGLAAGGEDTGVLLTASVDGEVFGRAPLHDMAWSFAELVSYASRGTALQPGDVIGSGTCGAGCIAERWGREGRGSFPPLRPGSVVTLDAGPLGRQTARVLAPAPVRAPLRDRREVGAARG